MPRLGAALLSLTFLSACDGFLTVRNDVDPNIGQVFASPQAIEQTIQSGFQSCHNSVETQNDGSLLAQMNVLSLEGYSAVGNFGMNVRVGIPRPPIVNGPGAINIQQDYYRLSLGSRLAANALNALAELRARGGTLGTPAQDLRARAFGMFAIGCHQGWLAMVYDSASIITPGMPSDSIPPLSGSASVMAAALALLDSAIAYASDPVAAGTTGFPLPALWASGNALTSDAFMRLVRSYRARFRAGVARDTAQRAAVDWATVIADAENGITADFMLTVGGTTGWVPGGNTNATLFYNMAPLYYGMADTSGGFDVWLARPLTSRDTFLVITPDRRWPQGTTRATQATNSTVPTTINSRPYVANATAQPSGHPWALSYYVFNRLQYLRNTGNSGAFPSMLRAEMDLLAAEGYLRTGSVAAAATKIDITRVARGQLPALSGVVTSATAPVPGGNGCVPRVPAPPSFTSTTCGTILEALKWEKRMETAYSGYGQWFFDSRGWGDLPENTALEFPVPYQELAAQLKPYYSLGGGLKSSAPRGTYGY